MPVATTVRDWGEAALTSFAAALSLFFAAIPKILGFAIILVLGWMLATLVQKAVTSLLRTVHFNNLSTRAGLTEFVQRMGLNTDAAGFIGHVAKWFVRLIAMVVAFDALGLPAVSEVLRQLLLWLPNLVVALVVLVIGGIAANALSSLVRASTAEAGFSRPEMIGKVARIAVWAFAIVVAVNQLGVAETIVNTLFTAIVFAFALAAGLAFGLGGRETASEMVRTWYRRGQEHAPKIARATEAAGEIAGETTPQQPGMERRQQPIGDRRRNEPGAAFGDD